jgi:methyl-accepting chemotaxis protein
MRKYSLFVLVFIIFLLLVAVLEGQIYFSSLIQKNRLIEEKASAQLQTLQFLDRTIFSPAWHFRQIVDPLLTQEFLDQVANLPDIFSIEVTDSTGSLFLASGESLKAAGIDKAEILSKTRGREDYSQEIKLHNKSARLIVYRGEFGKVFWLAFSQEEINKNISDLLRESIITGFIWLIIFAGIFLLIVALILKPLGELKNLFNQVRQGNLEVRARVGLRTEIGELAAAFNEMIKDLKESHAALEEAKAVLEVKVEARTKELRELTKGLEEEIERRTKEVRKRVDELERFQRLAVGRELKMLELKNEIRKLKKELEKSKRSNKINK